MGRTGAWGSTDHGTAPDAGARTDETEDFFLVTGADLYRISCQSCHQPSGKGCGAEIKSLVDPVRATSPTHMQLMMKERGRPISRSLAGTLASEARGALRERLRHGGQKMPAFEHFSSRETEALLNYLRRLVGVPDRELVPETTLRTSHLRMGEMIVRGTCHICHDAVETEVPQITSPYTVAIPPLAALGQTRSIREAIQKVRTGTSVPGARRGRMPLFPFLSEEEVAAAYIYLLIHPPQP